MRVPTRSLAVLLCGLLLTTSACGGEDGATGTDMSTVESYAQEWQQDDDDNNTGHLGTETLIEPGSYEVGLEIQAGRYRLQRVAQEGATCYARTSPGGGLQEGPAFSVDVQDATAEFGAAVGARRSTDVGRAAGCVWKMDHNWDDVDVALDPSPEERDFAALARREISFFQDYTDWGILDLGLEVCDQAEIARQAADVYGAALDRGLSGDEVSTFFEYLGDGLCPARQEALIEGMLIATGDRPQTT